MEYLAQMSPTVRRSPEVEFVLRVSETKYNSILATPNRIQREYNSSSLDINSGFVIYLINVVLYSISRYGVLSNRTITVDISNW